MGQIYKFTSAHFSGSPMNAISANKEQWSSLITKVAQDDRQAFVTLFNHFAPLLKTYAMSTQPILNASRAEEFVQETMLKVWRKAHQFNADKSSASTWIYAVGRNTRIDMLRAAKNIDTVTDAEDVWLEIPDERASQQQLLEQGREKAQVHQALEQLPPEQKQIIRMIYIEGKSHQEIANEQNIALGTVKSRARLALKKLSHRFKE